MRMLEMLKIAYRAQNTDRLPDRLQEVAHVATVAILVALLLAELDEGFPPIVDR